MRRLRVEVFPSAGAPSAVWWCSLYEITPPGLRLLDASGPGEIANPADWRTVLLALPAPPGCIEVRDA